MAIVKNKKRVANPYLSIILPVYNEAKNIKLQYNKIIKGIKPIKKKYEIIFIDDGSTDQSFENLSNLAKTDKNLKIIQFRRNFGQTAAMAAGIEYARGEIIIFMDADLQNDPNDIKKLLDKLDEGYDVVSGWRVNRKDKLFLRKIPSKIANKIISIISEVPLHDTGCSLKAYRSDILKKVKLYGEMHRFIPVHASWIGARIAEIPVNHHARKYGESKYGIRRTFKVLLDLLTIKFMGSFSTKPIYLYGGLGLILFILSFISSLAVILMKIFKNTNMTGNPLLLLTVLFVLMSFLLTLMGIQAEIMIRIYHENQNKPPYHINQLINIKK